MFHNETVHDLVPATAACQRFGVEPRPAGSGARCRRHSPAPSAAASESFNVSVLLPQDGDLVFKEDRVEPHLRVDQRHIAKPAGKSVHAALPLGKVVGVGPARGPGRL